jgi:hypothetical protein
MEGAESLGSESRRVALADARSDQDSGKNIGSRRIDLVGGNALVGRQDRSVPHAFAEALDVDLVGSGEPGGVGVAKIAEDDLPVAQLGRFKGWPPEVAAEPVPGEVVVGPGRPWLCLRPRNVRRCVGGCSPRRRP